MIPKIAVIGEGVIGCTSALQIAKAIPNSRITILHDKPFEKSCSAGPAGLFRIDYEENTEYGRASFAWFSHLYRTTKGAETGVKLVSGHIQSDNLESLKQQQRAYGDIVYNFRFLDDRERLDMFPEPSKHCIHHTAYASEGNKYVPYLKNLLLEQKVEFKQQEVKSLDEVADSGYDVIVNCAGLYAYMGSRVIMQHVNFPFLRTCEKSFSKCSKSSHVWLYGGKLAGDDDTCYPIRGVILEVDAPWHKHFNYRDFTTFTIPKENSVVIGSTKQDNRWDLEITDEDRNDILSRYIKLHPGMREPKILKEWSALRPGRKHVRIEAQKRTTEGKGKEYTVVHHYGHGSNGFTLGWGTAIEATKLVQKALGLM
ncbi:CBN-DDO-2 protein [Caenorhabditis brenneri]|uniref:CBN-DDO-2 protein n=1 Tax=Caenorhabditis brenneri TaxID=135651 RepID=G0N0V5_CAEBE|nr:CBN-DDO-2 protein [Caenorhabditis brenneri]